MKIKRLHLTAGVLMTTSIIDTAARPVLKHAVQKRQDSFSPTSRGSQFSTSHSSGYSTSSQMTPDGVVSKTTTLHGGNPITTAQTFKSSPGIGGNPITTSQIFQSSPGVGGNPITTSQIFQTPPGATLSPAGFFPAMPLGGLVPTMPELFNRPMLPPIPPFPTLDNPLKASALMANAQIQALNTASPITLPGLSSPMFLPTSGTPLIPGSPIPNLVLNVPPVQAPNTPVSTSNLPTSGIPAAMNLAPSNLMTMAPTQANNVPQRASTPLVQAPVITNPDPNKTVQSVDSLPPTSNVANGAQDVRPAPNVLAVAPNVPTQTPTLLASTPTPTPPGSIPTGQDSQETPQASSQTLNNLPQNYTAPSQTPTLDSNQTTQKVTPPNIPTQTSALIDSTGLAEAQNRPPNIAIAPPNPPSNPEPGRNPDTERRNSTAHPLQNFPVLALPSSITPPTKNDEKFASPRPKLQPIPIIPDNVPATINPQTKNDEKTASSRPKLEPIIPDNLPNTFTPSKNNEKIPLSRPKLDPMEPLNLPESRVEMGPDIPVIIETIIPVFTPSSIDGFVKISTFLPPDVNPALS